MELSKTQIDRLGERLKTGHFSEADLEALDRYRASHRDAYQKVVEVAISKAEKQSKSQDILSLKKKMLNNRKRIIDLMNQSFSVLREGGNK